MFCVHAQPGAQLMRPCQWPSRGGASLGMPIHCATCGVDPLHGVWTQRMEIGGYLRRTKKHIITPCGDHDRGKRQRRNSLGVFRTDLDLDAGEGFGGNAHPSPVEESAPECPRQESDIRGLSRFGNASVSYLLV